MLKQLLIAAMFILPLTVEALDEQTKINQLSPEAKETFTKFLEKAREQFPKHTIIVAETYRTQSRQNKLFKKGSSMTKVKVSKHTKRVAADIYFIKNGKISAYHEAPYLELGELGESFGLRWGGRWGQNGRSGPFDPGHYEVQG